MTDSEFFNLLFRETGVGMLLDVENLFVNSVPATRTDALSVSRVAAVSTFLLSDPGGGLRGQTIVLGMCKSTST